jgi:hypothetical protein
MMDKKAERCSAFLLRGLMPEWSTTTIQASSTHHGVIPADAGIHHPNAIATLQTHDGSPIKSGMTMFLFNSSKYDARNTA